MEQLYLLSEAYQIAFHTIMEYVKGRNVQLRQRNVIENDIYAMMVENDIKGVPLDELFPNGIEAFAKDLVVQANHRTMMEILIQLIRDASIGMIIVCLVQAFAQFCGDGRIPSQLMIDAAFVITAACYLMGCMFMTWMRRRYLFERRWAKWLQVGGAVLVVLFYESIHALMRQMDGFSLEIPFLPLLIPLILLAWFCIHYLAHGTLPYARKRTGDPHEKKEMA